MLKYKKLHKNQQRGIQNKINDENKTMITTKKMTQHI